MKQRILVLTLLLFSVSALAQGPGGSPTLNGLSNPNNDMNYSNGTNVWIQSWGVMPGNKDADFANDANANTGTGYMYHRQTGTSSTMNGFRFDFQGTTNFVDLLGGANPLLRFGGTAKIASHCSAHNLTISEGGTSAMNCLALNTDQYVSGFTGNDMVAGTFVACGDATHTCQYTPGHPGTWANVPLTGGVTSIQFQNGGTNYGSLMTGAAIMNFSGCTVSGTAPNFMITCSGGGSLVDPGANGVMTRTALNVTAPADAAALAAPMVATAVGGTANAITLTMVPALAAQTQVGTVVNFTPSANNTTNNPTAAVSGLTALVIKKKSSSGLVALASGDIVNGQSASLELDPTGTFWVLTNPQTSSGGGGTPCTTTNNSLQYDNSGTLGCVPNWVAVGSNIQPQSGATLDFNANNALLKNGMGPQTVSGDVLSNKNTNTQAFSAAITFPAASTASTFDGVHKYMRLEVFGEANTVATGTITVNWNACPVANWTAGSGGAGNCSVSSVRLWTSGALSAFSQERTYWSGSWFIRATSTPGVFSIAQATSRGIQLAPPGATLLLSNGGSACAACTGGSWVLYLTLAWSNSTAGSSTCLGISPAFKQCIGLDAMVPSFTW